MRVVLEQIFGSQESYDLSLCKPKLILENSLESEALANGWAIYNGEWYNSRSTRVSVNCYSNPKPIDGYKVEIIANPTDEQLEQLETVYESFLSLKGYKKVYDLHSDSDRSLWLLVVNDRIRAFTKFITYNCGLESNLTAWDYSEPKKAIGRKLVPYEINVARSLDYDYLYIGPGYQKSSVYKADLPGFEWWNGVEWSTDKAKYKNLCLRDSNIQTLEQLSSLYANDQSIIS